MSDLIENCLEKIDLDMPKEAMSIALEKCFIVASIQNFQGLINRFGAEKILNMEDDAFLNDVMSKMTY